MIYILHKTLMYINIVAIKIQYIHINNLFIYSLVQYTYVNLTIDVYPCCTLFFTNFCRRFCSFPSVSIMPTVSSARLISVFQILIHLFFFRQIPISFQYIKEKYSAWNYCCTFRIISNICRYKAKEQECIKCGMASKRRCTYD